MMITFQSVKFVRTWQTLGICLEFLLALRKLSTCVWNKKLPYANPLVCVGLGLCSCNDLH